MSEKSPYAGYRRVYKMRAEGENGLSIRVSMPKDVIDKAARERGLSIADFIKQYRAVATYDSFDGIHYTFERVPDVKEKDDGE